MIAKKRYFLLLSLVICSIGYGQEDDQAWQDVQAATRDATVHIFSTSRATNWFNPYVVCGTGTCTGSGFFINEEGYIATCSHVVDQALAVHVSIPALGKQRLKANVIGICPQHDIALLQLDEKAIALVCKTMGAIQFLEMADSDIVQRGENILALGYPGTTIETDQIKGTSGVISARLNSLFQLDAPLNPGNSGGPVLNKQGMVIGIANSVMLNAQNSNFATPINIYKTLLPDLYEHRLLKINHNGIIWTFSTEESRRYFNCPEDGGCLVCDVVQLSPAAIAGVQANDIIYSVNEYTIDNYGEIKALYDDEKMYFDHYIQQQSVGTHIILKVYRNGQPLELSLKVACDENDSISLKFPVYEKIDYEMFAGMIIMPLTVNYINVCSKERPGLRRYLTNLYGNNSRLVVANVFSDSKVSHMQSVRFGDTLNEVNGEKVNTLDDFRKALTKSVETGYVIIKTTDEITLDTDNVITVLTLEDGFKETWELAHIHQYPLSQSTKELLRKHFLAGLSC
ncbi:MAG TPA: trypsin-like peptidase domain-containing protein, partial [Candidatus Babeliales bacterium]|nr:trypsin-like peptidase domain-containing protein [Candidatus Babeliales bacterium]